MSITFSSIYVATAEIYPTTLRVTALGLGSSLARVGGALAPFIVYTVSGDGNQAIYCDVSDLKKFTLPTFVV